MIQTNHRRLNWLGGLAFNREFLVGSAEAQNSLEALGTARFQAFRYKEPELQFDTNLTVYPSITDWGRVRADFTIVLSYEVFTDFFVNLNLLDTYDSNPPVEGAATNSIRFTVSVGWSF